MLKIFLRTPIAADGNPASRVKQERGISVNFRGLSLSNSINHNNLKENSRHNRLGETNWTAQNERAGKRPAAPKNGEREGDEKLPPQPFAPY
jgi:hypothetical protein